MPIKLYFGLYLVANRSSQETGYPALRAERSSVAILFAAAPIFLDLDNDCL
jgi:hypothetical protein